jgi:hypothetical protein
MEVQTFESTGLTFERVWAALMENREQIKESIKEADRRTQETDRLIKATNKQIGELGRKFGSMVEHMMIPNLIEKFNNLGYTFEKYYTNTHINDTRNQIYVQIDLTLENGGCVMIVEVKADPNTGDVKDYVERMEKVREHADKHGDRRKFYGALAGAIFNQNVRDYTLKQGFYVVEQSGDTVNILAPPDAPRAW